METNVTRRTSTSTLRMHGTTARNAMRRSCWEEAEWRPRVEPSDEAETDEMRCEVMLRAAVATRLDLAA